MNIQIFDANKLTMSSLEIAELTGKRHDHVMADIRKMLDDLELQYPEFSGHYKDGRGRTQDCFYLPKRESLILVSGYSAVLRARIIDRWQQLESQQVKQPTPQIASPLEDDLRGIAFIADSMRLSDSGKLGMFTKYCQANAPRLLAALPAYAIDSPTDSTTGSSEATEPITEIVKGITSAVKANQALWATGIIEQKHRKGKDGLQKSYWSVTQEGLKYGKNITSPSNARETQPHWYVSKKDEIRKIVSDYLVS